MKSTKNYLCYTKQFDTRFAAISKGPLFAFNLLETKIIFFGVEVCQTWSSPSLIFLGIVLLQTSHILRHLLQNFTLEVTGLT
jgi:hypothetical protein